MKRSGFTAVELVIVVAIIAILVSMLLPAIQSVRQRASEAQVAVEIKALETGLTQFHLEFGSYPPSRIVIYEHTDGWMTDLRSRNILKRLWPQFDFGVPSTAPVPRIITWDFNGDGSSAPTDRYVLTGAECLAFFLAGPSIMLDGAPTGFSKNPRNPFEIAGGTRIGPFTKFDIDRWTDVDNDGVPEYRDTLGRISDVPYLYLSSYDGRGYQPDHDADVFLPHAPFAASVPDTRPDLGIDSNGDGIKDTGRVYTQDQPMQVAWKRNDYQIISPGWDGEYGQGGYYRKDVEKDKFPKPDWDNLTNFSSGLLSP